MRVMLPLGTHIIYDLGYLLTPPITPKTMLYSLSIRNFVLVEHLELELQDGFTTITGETGAGKSILIEALALLLGERADSGVVREGCDESEISAAFDLSPTINVWLEAQDLNSFGECIIRRIIMRNGRSRAYINDRAVTVQTLRELGRFLVDIHSQHAHQALLRNEVQRMIVDNTAAHQNLLDAVAHTYQHWRDLTQQLHDLGGNAAERAAQIHFLRYQTEELENAEISDVAALHHLLQEHHRLAHASQLQANAESALALLDNEHGGISALYQAQRALLSVVEHDTHLRPLLELLDSTAIQAQEVAEQLRHYTASLEHDPQALDALEQRLADVHNLARKHQLTLAELPAKLHELRTKLDNLEHYEEHAARLEEKRTVALAQYRNAAHALSQGRMATALVLGQRISANIQQLGMPKGAFAIDVIPHPDAKPSALGTDSVEFLVSANPGQTLRPLNKVASGGELARISLAVQVIAAHGSGVPTLVFDEVDVGVGGRVAEIIGRQLSALGTQRQVLCITHLPQVAACGKQHLQVSKNSHANSTHTEIKRLNPEARVEELARMLGGLEITSSTLAHAREMLALNHGAHTSHSAWII
jgi:DNA repair protein RecN (Recombination protein N)